MRQLQHNSNHKTERYDLKLYKIARENAIEKLECILVEQIEFEELDELRMKEEYYRVELNSNLNERCCYITEDLKEYKKKYYEEHKEEIKENQKKYIEEHKEEINKYKKEYYEENKEKIKEYRKEYNKKHYQENKEDIKEHKKKYRQENKEKIREKTKKKIECECGGKYTYGKKVRHLKTKKHQNYIKNKNQPVY
jgi:hypothetical protein